MIIEALIAACIQYGAPPARTISAGDARVDPLALVHPATMRAVVRVESGGNPLALNVNKLRVQPARPQTVPEAVQTAERFIALGYSVDIGLGQINNRNLAGLGLTIAEVLDPCTNLRAAATILVADYRRALGQFGEGQPALLAALSAYNTGSFSRGFLNGYVGRYTSAPVPALVTVQATARIQPAQQIAAPLRRVDPRMADTTVSWGPGGDG